MKIGPDKVVSFHFVLSNDEGFELDRSAEDTPLTYMHGRGAMISGLETALEGRSVGDEFRAVVQPDEAFGEVDEALIQELPRDAFEGVEKLEPGMQFRATTNEGATHAITVVEVNGDKILVDGNHPLAGVTLTFDVSVHSVRDATDEEMAHGHAHD